MALLPGDRRRDARLDEASTLDPDAVLQIWRYFDEGGPENMAACLAFFASQIGGAADAPPPVSVSAFGRFDGACFEAEPDAARALIVFYRSIYLANDLEPIEALARALRDKGFAVTSIFVTSLKDEAALERLRAFLDGRRFDVVLNATAFSARLDEGEGTALDALDAPVLQVVLAGVGLDAWRASQRGLGPSDLAMHVALPEIDGRILTPRHLLQGGERARRADRIRRCRASAARRPGGLRRRARSSLGEPPAQSCRRTNASLACCRTIQRAADAPAMRSASIRLRAPSRSARLYAPRAMMWPAVWMRRHSSPLSPKDRSRPTLTLAEYEAELASTP